MQYILDILSLYADFYYVIDSSFKISLLTCRYYCAYGRETRSRISVEAPRRRMKFSKKTGMHVLLSSQ